MEPDKRGSGKPTVYAIFSKDSQKIVEVPSGDHNIGIDYEVKTPDQATRAWCSGVIEYAEHKGTYVTVFV